MLTTLGGIQEVSVSSDMGDTQAVEALVFSHCIFLLSILIFGLLLSQVLKVFPPFQVVKLIEWPWSLI